MPSKSKLSQYKLNMAFLIALKDYVIHHSQANIKPLDIDLKPPLPLRTRLYIYNVTNPPGGRALNECKIQLMVPGQKHGQNRSFDYNGERIIILSGYYSELKVFVLWDAGLYTNFAFSRNVQVKAETIYEAFAGKISQQIKVHKGNRQEIIIASRAEGLHEAILLRMKLTLERVERD